MSNKFGVFINLDYAHKPKHECLRIWQVIMEKMLTAGFSFQKRVFAINTEKNPDEIAIEIKHLLDEIQTEQQDFYNYITDCYFLNLNSYKDLTLPDTGIKIEVEYNLLFKQNLSAVANLP